MTGWTDFDPVKMTERSLELSKKLFLACGDEDILTGYVASTILCKLLKAKLMQELPVGLVDQLLDSLEADVGDAATMFIGAEK